MDGASLGSEDWEKKRAAIFQKFESVAETASRQKEQLVINHSRLDRNAEDLNNSMGLVTGITEKTV